MKTFLGKDRYCPIFTLCWAFPITSDFSLLAIEVHHDWKEKRIQDEILTCAFLKERNQSGDGDLLMMFVGFLNRMFLLFLYWKSRKVSNCGNTPTGTTTARR